MSASPSLLLLGLTVWSALALPLPQHFMPPPQPQPSRPLVLTQALPNDPVAQATVKIDQTGDGSGVIVGRSGDTYTVLTNWHVVKNPGTYVIVTADSRRHSPSQVQRLGNLDIAVLTFTSDVAYPPLSPTGAPPARVGDSLTLYGHPSRGLPGFRSRTLQRVPNLPLTGLLGEAPPF